VELGWLWGTAAAESCSAFGDYPAPAASNHYDHGSTADNHGAAYDHSSPADNEHHARAAQHDANQRSLSGSWLPVPRPVERLLRPTIEETPSYEPA
jgi:hypothetical protein